MLTLNCPRFKSEARLEGCRTYRRASAGVFSRSNLLSAPIRARLDKMILLYIGPILTEGTPASLLHVAESLSCTYRDLHTFILYKHNSITSSINYMSLILQVHSLL